MPRKATNADYVVLQGGRPSIEQGEDGLWRINHEYATDSPMVVTHVSPESRGTIIVGGIEYSVAELWEFEGAPCERQSNTVGGYGYERRR